MGNPNTENTDPNSPFEPCSILLAKINGIYSINKQIVTRVLKQPNGQTHLTFGYSHAFRSEAQVNADRKRARSVDTNSIDPFDPLSWTDILSARRTEELPKVELVERACRLDVLSDLKKRWIPSHSGELRCVPDVFNDGLKMEYSNFESLVDLLNGIIKVTKKYELFGESPKASEALRDFLHNLEVIQVELGGIEDSWLSLERTVAPEVTYEEADQAVKEFQQMVLEADKELMVIAERVRQGFINLSNAKAKKFAKEGKKYKLADYANKYVIPKTNASSLSIMEVLPDEVFFGNRRAIIPRCTYA